MMKRLIRPCLVAAALMLPVGAAQADIVLSQLVIDLQPGKHDREDIEVWNNGPDRTYVSVEPHEVVDPGTPTETRRDEPDPEKLGLLVSPARMILEPGQRKLIRVAALASGGDRERDYRVTVKPVVGKLSSATSGLKVLVGYDALVMLRPTVPRASVNAVRSGDRIDFRNDGNVSVELVEGRQCDPTGKACADLPGKRLYPGSQWSEQVKPGLRAEYLLRSPGQAVKKQF